MLAFQLEETCQGYQPLLRRREVRPDHADDVRSLRQQALRQDRLLHMGELAGDILCLHDQQAAAGQALFDGLALIIQLLAPACDIRRLRRLCLAKRSQGLRDLLEPLLGLGHALLGTTADGRDLLERGDKLVGVLGPGLDRQEGFGGTEGGLGLGDPVVGARFLGEADGSRQQQEAGQPRPPAYPSRRSPHHTRYPLLALK